VTDRFRFPIRATSADIDELGHVSNQVYLRWVLDAATSHSIARGWGHDEYKAAGVVWVVRRHELDYLAAVVADEELVAETWVESWRAASCVRKTEITRGTTVVLRAETTWAFVQFPSGRPTRIPEPLRTLFTG
jgi:acyl-CoA thioester hydrolase